MKTDWTIVYEKAIREDGSLLFPEKLTAEFLERAKRTMGSYIFANQYLNEVIPDDAQTFKKHWFKYYATLPDRVHNFAYIDPAISEADSADFTALVVISVDEQQNWFVRHASRHKINPSQLIELAFDCYNRFKPALIGIEDVAFQRSLIHFAHEEMKRRKIRIPITGVKQTNETSKETRILGLVPRFEWGTLFLTHGLTDLELELLQFPRGAHDDCLDALASLSSIVHYPSKIRRKDEIPSPTSPDYEAWFIRYLAQRPDPNSGG